MSGGDLMIRSLRRLAVLGLACAVFAAAPAAAREFAGMVVMGPEGANTARVETDAPACPAIRIDGRARPMRERAAPGELPLRPTASASALSKPAVFPVRVCEARLPKGARHVVAAGHALPVPRPVVRRIVVIGDTGCRLKQADHAYQACNDPAAYPFARVAARAAAWKPDLVLHVGDYLYRENPCAAATPACAGSPWGYGWDAWNADFFAPAAPLLAAAPWIVVRGNHEECDRAGQGWWRLLDPRPLAAGRDCIDPANDVAGDDSPPYAVPLGRGAQVVVLDMMTAPNKPLPAEDARHAQYLADYATLARLARRAPYTLLTLHKPILGFAAVAEPEGPPELKPNTLGIQSVFAEADPELLPAGVGVILSGHIHLWQQLDFAGARPSQFVAGFSGTQEDIVPFPRTLPAGASPGPGAAVAAFSSWIDGFGYMTLERRAADRWDVKVWNLDGQVVNRCEIRGRRSRCDEPQV
jgi:hypothetical protein